MARANTTIRSSLPIGASFLTERGAVIDGSLHAPSAADLEHADVVVIYKGDAAYLPGSAKSDIEAFVKRGGGLVSFHDSLCGPDPAYFATLVGGAKKHGEVNYTFGRASSLHNCGQRKPDYEGYVQYHNI